MKRVNNYNFFYPDTDWKKLVKVNLLVIMFLIITGFSGNAQQVVTGVVVDSRDLPLPGVTIVRVDRPEVGVVTNVDGEFAIAVDAARTQLRFSFVGMETQTIDARSGARLRVVLEDAVTMFDEVVVVGFGQQRKASVVASITSATGAELERTGGVSSVGAALTGKLPGVITIASTGMPGQEDPRILVRARTTWNNADPLILVDGIERPLSSVDINSVESITVLKDASATAVYGVRGANGVILITTRRGREGRAEIRITANTTVKSPSKLPGKLDSYDALHLRNRVIEHELGTSPESWAFILPSDIIHKYRYPANIAERERFPNVNWQDELFSDFASSYNASINITGGTRYVRYFASADFLNEGSLFRVQDNNRGYQSGYGFERLNVRSNLDFQLTPTTLFIANVAGSRGKRQHPWGAGGLGEERFWGAAYQTAPTLFLPRYSDGTWGFHAPNEQLGLNSVQLLAISGLMYTTQNRITTDFTLDQDLKMIAEGLRIRGTVSLDNAFEENQRGINDQHNPAQAKWIDPATGETRYRHPLDQANRFDFQELVQWTANPGTVANGATMRRLFYQVQLNYDVTIADRHHLGLMGVVNRNEFALGNEIPRRREDWVFRTSYNFDDRYTIEFNGAYNGSEKFAPEFRFGFFASGGVGWMLSEESFMDRFEFLDMLKLRASYGEIGDDNVAGRWLYMTQWLYGGVDDNGRSRMSVTGQEPAFSPYTWFREGALGNPQVRWERVAKLNLGTDFAVFEGLFAGSIDFFRDRRSDILIAGDQRTVPVYFGANAPVGNIGIVEAQGFEFELRLSREFGTRRDLRLWSNINISHSQNRVLEADDPPMMPAYQQDANFPMFQTRSFVDKGYFNTWDELFASTPHSVNDIRKLPGSFHILDYNADGVIDVNDNIPYGFPATPENTYNVSIGADWRGFSAFVQFYGVNNVNRQVVFHSFSGQNNLAFDEGTYWSEDNVNADVPLPRWNATPSEFSRGSRYMFDGSFLRLKNAEISYTFDSGFGWVNRARLQNVRIFVSGNNLWLWTRMPDDRESNFAGTGWAAQGAYPTVKRYNFGVNITF